jgi:hypothetical protein
MIGMCSTDWVGPEKVYVTNEPALYVETSLQVRGPNAGQPASQANPTQRLLLCGSGNQRGEGVFLNILFRVAASSAALAAGS